MLRRRVVRNSPVVGRHTNGTWRGRPDDIGQSSGQGADAHHATALPTCRLVVIPGRRDGLRDSPGAIPRFGRGDQRRMIMRMSIRMHVLRGSSHVFVDMHDAHTMLVFRYARCRASTVRPSK